jgi:hypothetical protein
VTDFLYSGAYAVLFASLLSVSLSVIDAPQVMHLLNLVPVATAIADAAENFLMLALLSSPRKDVAGWVVIASAVKWQLLLATASVVGGTGAFCVYKALKQAGKGTKHSKARNGAGAAVVEGEGPAGGAARGRKPARRA